MDKRFCLIILACVALALLPAQTARAGVIFSDDFEGYANNAYPAPPWVNLFSGANGYVTNAVAHNGSQSFRSESYYDWARWDYVTLSLPDLFSYHAAVRLTTAGRGCAVGFGFMQPGTTNTGRWANAVHFANDGTILFSTRTAGVATVGSWSPGTWYEVVVVLDYTTLLADVYINGSLAGDDLAMDPKTLPASLYGTPVPLDQFGMFGDNFPATAETSVNYYDDLLVTTDLPVPVEGATWGKIKAMFGE
jgi:hypothetical protein